MTDEHFNRISVNIHPEIAALMREIMEKRQCTATEAIRQCIAVTAAIHEEWRQGSIVIFRRPDGRELELIDTCPPQTPEAKESDR